MQNFSDLPEVVCRGDAHAWGQSLEVLLPFLHEILADFQLAPAGVGEADQETMAEVLQPLWGIS